MLLETTSPKHSNVRTKNAQDATEEIDMDNLDQGFFASGLDSFDMGVIQNRFGIRVSRGLPLPPSLKGRTLVGWFRWHIPRIRGKIAQHATNLGIRAYFQG